MQSLDRFNISNESGNFNGPGDNYNNKIAFERAISTSAAVKLLTYSISKYPNLLFLYSP